jgi:hypothetical protein
LEGYNKKSIESMAFYKTIDGDTNIGNDGVDWTDTDEDFKTTGSLTAGVLTASKLSLSQQPIFYRQKRVVQFNIPPSVDAVLYFEVPIVNVGGFTYAEVSEAGTLTIPESGVYSIYVEYLSQSTTSSGRTFRIEKEGSDDTYFRHTFSSSVGYSSVIYSISGTMILSAGDKIRPIVSHSDISLNYGSTIQSQWLDFMVVKLF